MEEMGWDGMEGCDGVAMKYLGSVLGEGVDWAVMGWEGGWSEVGGE